MEAQFQFGSVIDVTSPVTLPSIDSVHTIWNLLPQHNPDINLHAEFCPCGCNQNYKYTSIKLTNNGPIVSRQVPETTEEWTKWREDNLSWEAPLLSRAPITQTWTKHEKGKIYCNLNQRVERCIIHRLLPGNTKRVARIYVGSLDPDLWAGWIRLISKGTPPVNMHHWSSKVPTHEEKQKVWHDKVTWVASMPNLVKERPMWWAKKWACKQSGKVFLAEVTQLSFLHNGLTEQIIAHVTYTVKFFNVVSREWRIC